MLSWPESLIGFKSSVALLLSFSSLSLFSTSPFVDPVDVGTPATDRPEVYLGVSDARYSVALWMGEGTADAEGNPSLNVQASILNFGKSWSNPYNFGSIGNGSSSLALAVNGSGLALALWINFGQEKVLLQGAWLNLNQPTPDWSMIHDFILPSNGAEDLKLVMDARGNAVALWVSSEDGTIRGATLVDGLERDWVPSVFPTEVTEGSCENVQMVVDPDSGHAVPVWTLFKEGTLYLQRATLPFGSTAWSMPENLAFGSAEQFGIQTLSLAALPEGRALIAWSEVGAPYINTWIYEEATGSTWQDRIPLNSSNGDVICPQISTGFDYKKAAPLVVWREDPIDETSKIYSSIFLKDVEGVSWSNPLLLSAPLLNAYFPMVATDRKLSATWAAWQEVTEEGSSITAAELSEDGASWEKPFIVTKASKILSGPLINVGPSNYPVMLWTKYEENLGTKVQSSHIASLAPPQNPQGRRLYNRFLFQAKPIDELTWLAPEGQAPHLYRIYRDSDLKAPIGTVSATSPLIFREESVLNGATYTYYIVSENSIGDQSAPVTVTLPSKPLTK